MRPVRCPERVLDALPDEGLVLALEAVRGRGRDDYPVRAMWRGWCSGAVRWPRWCARWAAIRRCSRCAALERVNARLDRSFEFEQHFIRGLSRMRTRVGLALSVMMALASGQAPAGRPQRMRSLYGPVP